MQNTDRMFFPKSFFDSFDINQTTSHEYETDVITYSKLPLGSSL